MQVFYFSSKNLEFKPNNKVTFNYTTGGIIKMLTVNLVIDHG